MQKLTLVALGIVVALSLAVVTVADDDTYAAEPTYELSGVDGMGTSTDPYLVDSADDLIMIDGLSSAMRGGTYVYVELVANIDITGADVSSDGYFIYTFNGTFDGNGYSIIGSNPNASFLFYYTLNESVITDFTVNTDSQMILVFLNNTGSDITMSDITIEGNGQGTLDNTNYAPFMAHSFGSVTMERCVNNADLVIGNYGAVFIGGYVWNASDVSFIDCVNNGNITGVNTSLFIGNMNKIDIGTLTIDGCVNTGTIIGSKNTSYFFANGPAAASSVAETINNACKTGGTGSNLSASGNQIANYSIEAISGNGSFEKNDTVVSIDSSTHTATLTSGTASYAVFSIGAYASGNGSWMTTIYGGHVDITSGSATIDIPVQMITSQALAEIEYGLNTSDAVDTGTTGNGFTWYRYNISDSGLYAVDFGNTEWTMNDMTSLRLGVTVYSSNGNALSYAYTDGVKVTKPTPSLGESTTYYKVFVVNEGQLNLVSDSRYVPANGNFTFTLAPGEGYTLADNIEVTAGSSYDSSATGYIPYDCNLQGGEYVIENVRSNVYISIPSDALVPITYSISYNLSNVYSTSNVMNVGYKAPFTTTLVTESGYSLSDVVVTVGGAVISDVYNAQTGQVSILNVTGDVVITASASFVPPIWDDDDDYVPPIVPSQTDDSGDDNTTAIVACAAAAVVAALLAAFLIIDRRQ